MRLNIARKVGSKHYRPSTPQFARGHARPQQCPEYAPTDLSAKTKAADNGSDLETTNNESIATESAHAPLINVQPRASTASTPRQWFNDRLWQVIRGLASKEVADTLKEQLRISQLTDSRRARLGYNPLQRLPLVLRASETSLHVIRLLHALKQWESRRLDLTPRQRRRFGCHIKLLRHVRLALDSSQVQPDKTADTIFLFGQGFVEILKAGTKGNIRGPDSAGSELTGPCRIEVLTHLLNDINTQLAEDINNVVSKRGLPFLEHDTKILSVSNSSLLSPRDYQEILSRFSPTLQQHIRNGLLYDLAGLRYEVLKEQPRPGLKDDLASLIEHELSRPKKRSERRPSYDRRRASLLFNAEWIRERKVSRESEAQNFLTAFTQPTPEALCVEIRRTESMQLQQDDSTAKLRMMSRWRNYHLSRLRTYQRSRDGCIGTKRRMMQIKATIDDITKAISHLQSAKPATQCIPEREFVIARSSTEDPIENEHAIGGSIGVKPAALSDSMIFQLSRELLDSFNEAAYTFGQQYAPVMMQKGGWTGPDKIDFPIFISSFYLYPNLFSQIIGHQEIFDRLRELRNHTAHGGGSMTTGDILLALDDFAAAARFFRSPGLVAQVERYRTLLNEFTATQNEHLRTAYRVVQPFTEKLKAELEERKSVSKDGEPAPGKAGTQSIASEVARIKEAWTHTEQSLLQLAAYQITRFVGKAQIRRIMRNMGPDASSVLSELQKEQAARPDKASNTPGVEEILNSLSEKLSQRGAQHADLPHTNAKANNGTANPSIGPEGLTPELLDRLPSGRTASSGRQAQQQKEELRQLANKVRKKE
jgi:hypothetical protein